jgi:hypothetical protein
LVAVAVVDQLALQVVLVVLAVAVKVKLQVVLDLQQVHLAVQADQFLHLLVGEIMEALVLQVRLQEWLVLVEELVG